MSDTPKIDIRAALRQAVDDFPIIHLRPDTTFAHALAEIERLDRAVEVAESMADVIEDPQSFGRGALGNLAKRFRKALNAAEGGQRNGTE